MKNSGIEWIGEIPEDWEVKKVKYIFSERKNKNIGTKEKNLLSLSYGKIVRKNITNMEGLIPESYETYNILQPGDIVFRLTDLQNDKHSLRTGLCKEKGIITSAYTTVIPPKKVDPVYIHYLFHAYDNCKVFYNLGDGVRQGMKYSDLCKLNIILPPKETQQRIASYLDKKCSKIEETIQNQQQVIEKLKAYKQSLITEAVTGKVKIENGKVCGEYESYKDSGVEWIGKIPSEWEVKKLKYIADSFSKGSGITKEEIVINGDIPCVRYGELYTKYDYHFTECQTRTNLGIIETPKYFSHGDVLFTCTGELVEEIGKSIAYLGNEKCLAGGDIIVLKHSQDPMFMGFALDSKYVQGQKSFGKTKLKVVHISSGEIARLLIVLPPKEEQKEIADYLDKKCTAIDTAIEQKQKLIEKLTEYKKSLIYECVTGKKVI